jgi:hypothetical protein
MSGDNSYEILIRLDQRVGDMHTQLLGPDGRIPKVEETIEDHAEKIHTFTGGMRMGMYIISGIGIIMMAFGGVLLAHILGGH